MVTAVDVVYVLETADFFAGAYDHVSHRHPFDGVGGCGCPPELVEARALLLDGASFCYADGVAVTRNLANRLLRSGPRPASGPAAAVRLLGWPTLTAAAAGSGIAAAGPSAPSAALAAAVAGFAVVAQVRSRLGCRAAAVAMASGVVTGDRLPQRHEMTTTMAALQLVGESRVARLRAELGPRVAEEFDQEVTAALHEAALAAEQVADAVSRCVRSGRFQELPRDLVWVGTGTQAQLNRRVVLDAGGSYVSADLASLAGAYRSWVAACQAVCGLTGWRLPAGQFDGPR